MAKVRKRKLSLVAKVFIFYFVPCFCFYILVSIFLTSANNSLSIDIQSKKEAIEELRLSNQQLDAEIQSLRSKDRIYTIAKESGLEQIQNNVVNIQESEGNEAK